MSPRFWTLTGLALAATLMGACSSIWPSHEALVAAAEGKLSTKRDSLPVPPGAVLVGQAFTGSSGTIQGCESRWLQTLYGTNELSYAEVLDFYASALRGTEWQATAVYTDAVSFDAGDEFSMDVADYYNVSNIGPATVREAKSKFRTIYIVGLYTPLQMPVPSSCRGGG